MQAAGYVLVGGLSTRMGTDKALLPFNGTTLMDFVASQVLEATGNVTLVGNPSTYANRGYPVIADRLPGNGPLGGITAALAASPCEWSLITACDMPKLTADFLRRLLDTAFAAPGQPDCVVPETERGVEPLCAVYHARALPLLDSFLNHKFLKMQDAVHALRSLRIPFADSASFHNVNTPADLNLHE